MTKRVGVLMSLLLLASGCCLKARECVESDGRVQDAAMNDGAREADTDVGTMAEAGGVATDGLQTDTRPQCQGSCTGMTPICGPEGMCVKCSAAGGDIGCKEATAGEAPACSLEGRCVQCVNNSHCTNAGEPVCRDHSCVTCIADSECTAGPGVCLTDGRCAGADEVIEVRSGATCSDTAPNAGSADKPFCNLQKAVDAAMSRKKPAVLVYGERSQTQLSFDYPDSALLVVGRNAATLNPGAAGSGISLRAGKLTVRSFVVRGADDVGVVASGASSELHLQQMTVTGNVGGILLNGAAFVVENTIVARNRAAAVQLPAPALFGGVLVNNPPAAGPARLVHVTVVENENTGVVCQGRVPQATGLALSNAPHVNAFGCGAVECCSANLALTSSWRLTKDSSACIDKVPSTASLLFDIDMNRRPWPAASGLSDCGAHEFSQ